MLHLPAQRVPLEYVDDAKEVDLDRVRVRVRDRVGVGVGVRFRVRVGVGVVTELGGVGQAAHDGRARWADLGGEGEVQRLQRDLAAPAHRACAAADLRGGVARSLAD